MAKQQRDIVRKSAVRFGECSDGALCIMGADEEIRIMTLPKFETITFTTSGCQSKHTKEALMGVFNAMRKDNIDTPQQDCKNDHEIQQRLDDFNGKLTVWRNRDMKISIMPREHENYIHFNAGMTRSPNTRDALIELFDAIQKDNKETPQ